MKTKTNAQVVRDVHGKCCASTSMSESGCTLIQPPPPRFLLSGTRYQKEHSFDKKLCDYLLFWLDKTIGESIAVVELKSGHVPSSVVEQLKNGAQLAENLALPNEAHFAAVLVTTKGVHPLERKVIARQKIRYRNKEYPVQTLGSTAQVLSAEPWRSNRAKSKK